MTGPVTARWEDTVRFARALLLEWQGAASEAEAAYRDLLTSALAGGRLLHSVLGSCGLADVLTRRGALDEADDVLHRADDVLARGADARQRARLGSAVPGCSASVGTCGMRRSHWRRRPTPSARTSCRRLASSGSSRRRSSTPGPMHGANSLPCHSGPVSDSALGAAVVGRPGRDHYLTRVM